MGAAGKKKKNPGRGSLHRKKEETWTEIGTHWWTWVSGVPSSEFTASSLPPGTQPLGQGRDQQSREGSEGPDFFLGKIGLPLEFQMACNWLPQVDGAQQLSLAPSPESRVKWAFISLATGWGSCLAEHDGHHAQYRLKRQ